MEKSVYKVNSHSYLWLWEINKDGQKRKQRKEKSLEPTAAASSLFILQADHKDHGTNLSFYFLLYFLQAPVELLSKQMAEKRQEVEERERGMKTH